MSADRRCSHFRDESKRLDDRQPSIPVLIPPDIGKRKGTRPGWDGGPYAFMRHVLETTLGKALYRKHPATVEAMFAKCCAKFERIERWLPERDTIRSDLGFGRRR